MIPQRYSRQGLFEGWDQSRWSSLSAAVIGESLLGQHICDCLAATGIGKLKLVGNKRICNDVVEDGFLAHKAVARDLIVNKTSEFLSRLNPFVKVSKLVWYTRGNNLEQVVKDHDIIFDATNDVVTKEHMRDYAAKHNKFLVSGSCERYKGCYKTLEKDEDISFFGKFFGKAQGPVPALLLAGLMVETARKRFMPYDGFELEAPQDIFWYNLCSRGRFNEKADFKIPEGDLSSKSVCAAGVGALGVPVAVALAGENISRLGLLDYEAPDESNLARQTLYHDCLGQPKTSSLAEKIRKINPSIEPIVHDGKLVGCPTKPDRSEIYPEDLMMAKYDLIMRCFDNFEATVVLNNMRFPVIYGGTSFSSASISAYIPGATSCLNCTVDAKANAKQELDRDSCDNVPEPSIITTSKITAGMMCGEAVLYLKGLTSELINGIIYYDLFEPAKLNIRRFDKICNCSGGQND